ncbi:Eaa protein [Salmonella enterica]|nr:Eaa protein [Salmonella enterica]EEK8482202.1 Eaa protein [Salmonella enterica]
MTITKERLLKIQHWRETYGADSNVMLPAEEAEELARIALASLEAEPIGAFHIEDQQVSGTTDYIKDGEWPIDNGVIDVYAAPPAPVDNEFIPKNLDKALGVVGVALPESKEEFNFQIERWIQRLIDRVIRYADEFKEQPAPVVPPAIEPDYKVIKSILPTANPDEYACCIAADMWNACRSAMLNGGKS